MSVQKSVFTLLLLATAMACQKPATVRIAPPPPIPSNSATMISIGRPRLVLAHQAYDKLSAYISEKYQCNEFSIDSVEDATSDKELVIDTWGQLKQGMISEKWHLTMCSKKTTFGMIFRPDGNGGIYIGIAELKSLN